MTNDRSIVIKKVGKEYCAVVWDRNDYLIEAEKQLSDTKVYRDVSNTKNILSKLSEVNNKMFNSLKRGGFLTESKWNILLISLKKPLTSANYTFYLRSIKRFIMFLKN